MKGSPWQSPCCLRVTYRPTWCDRRGVWRTSVYVSTPCSARGATMTGNMQRRRGPHSGGSQEPQEGPHGTSTASPIEPSASRQLLVVIFDIFFTVCIRGLEYWQGEHWPLLRHPPYAHMMHRISHSNI